MPRRTLTRFATPTGVAGGEADELLRQYLQEALGAKASGGSTKLYDQ